MTTLQSRNVVDTLDEFGGEVSIRVAQSWVGTRLPHYRPPESGVLGADAPGNERLKRRERSAYKILEQSAAYASSAWPLSAPGTYDLPD
jgi:hypothetical protein